MPVLALFTETCWLPNPPTSGLTACGAPPPHGPVCEVDTLVTRVRSAPMANKGAPPLAQFAPKIRTPEKVELLTTLAKSTSGIAPPPAESAKEEYSRSRPLPLPLMLGRLKRNSGVMEFSSRQCTHLMEFAPVPSCWPWLSNRIPPPEKTA